MSLLAVGGHVRKDAQKEVSLQASVKGCGDDNVTSLCQIDAFKHRSWVDVDAPTNLLLSDMHAVSPV